MTAVPCRDDTRRRSQSRDYRHSIPLNGGYLSVVQIRDVSGFIGPTTASATGPQILGGVCFRDCRVRKWSTGGANAGGFARSPRRQSWPLAFRVTGHEDKACYTPVLCALTDKNTEPGASPPGGHDAVAGGRPEHHRNAPAAAAGAAKAVGQRPSGKSRPRVRTKVSKSNWRRKPQLRRRFMPSRPSSRQRISTFRKLYQ